MVSLKWSCFQVCFWQPKTSKCRPAQLRTSRYKHKAKPSSVDASPCSCKGAEARGKEMAEDSLVQKSLTIWLEIYSSLKTKCFPSSFSLSFSFFFFFFDAHFPVAKHQGSKSQCSMTENKTFSKTQKIEVEALISLNKMEVLPGPLPDGRRSVGDEGLGSRPGTYPTRGLEEDRVVQ